MDYRIASVQPGDYGEALRIIGSGQNEPYFGMRYSLEVLKELFGCHPHLVVSLTAPQYVMEQGNARLVGLPCPRVSWWRPGTAAHSWWAFQVLGELKRFQPSHVLLRTGNPYIANAVLGFCLRRGISVMAIFACCIERARGLKDALLQRSLVRRLNHPLVHQIGNHKQFATQTLIARGVAAEKAVAWDWPSQRDPARYPVKQLTTKAFRQIVFAGSMVVAKGVGDLVDAVRLLHARGTRVHLLAIGDGPDLPRLKTAAEALPSGLIDFAGRLGNDEVFSHMLSADLVCVPSRHEFTEGLPLTLTEALASRTPVVASDHPMIASAFAEGEGMRFFRAADSSSLAEVLQVLLTDGAEYERLSMTTSVAFERVRCRTMFGDLIDNWRQIAMSNGASEGGECH